MYCKECGAKIKDESKFCPKCGAKIVAVPPRHAAPDTRVPLIARGGMSSHDKASTRETLINPTSCPKASRASFLESAVDRMRSKGQCLRLFRSLQWTAG
ncbi:MAG: zinc ribbon domain-containing protein [Atopobium sp.]|nr:zinc ribbon domain-containing protein [Atopobium sp.]